MVGSIGYATNQGLGIMVKSFFDHGLIDKYLIVPHGHHETHYQWYEGRYRLFPQGLDWLLQGLDTLLLFETPYDWQIIPMAQKLGIKVVLQPNECTRYPFITEPDLIHCPSALELEIYKGKNLFYVPVPVEVKWRKRERAKVFVHNAGHGGLLGRNGTALIIEAMRFVQSPIKLIIRSQEEIPKSNDPRIEFRIGTFPYETLFDEGDVFLFPDKCAGLSLPLQEAYASGMLVMTSNRFPLNTWLPKEPLIPVKEEVQKRIVQYVKYALIDPQDIAKTIDAWYDMPIEDFSLRGKQWALDNSWQKLLPKYKQMLGKK